MYLVWLQVSRLKHELGNICLCFRQKWKRWFMTMLDDVHLPEVSFDLMP